jgi:hypothetical protein
MTVILFTGPTLSPHEAGQRLEAVCLPPAAQGDVYRASLRRPFAIGLIDGYFERVPAVWHKEILWAMSEGIHVFGSASMGALRAAELAPFGMIGVGAIFEAFRDGVLEDDDEVAVTHSAAEHDYRAGSEAMVNIRATLARAQTDGVINAGAHATLERIAKQLFYPERSYDRILELAASMGVPAGELGAIHRWLPGGALNQKRVDALAMLQAIADLMREDPGAKRVSWSFEHTVFWDELRHTAADLLLLPADDGDGMVLAELRRDPEAAARTDAAALGWWLAAERARRDGGTIDAVTLLDEARKFCEARALADSTDLARWLARNHCSRHNLEQLLAAHARIAQARAAAPGALEASLLDMLRWTGEYAVLLERVRRSKAR